MEGFQIIVFGYIELCKIFNYPNPENYKPVTAYDGHCSEYMCYIIEFPVK